MIPVFQTRGGREGNCWPACLASLLECELSEVDHCSMQHEDAAERTQAFLAERGMFYLEVAWEPTRNAGYIPITDVPDGTLVILYDHPPTLGHAMIGSAIHDPDTRDLAFRVIHDPARPDGSIGKTFDIRRIIFLCRLFK